MTAKRIVKSFFPIYGVLHAYCVINAAIQRPCPWPIAYGISLVSRFSSHIPFVNAAKQILYEIHNHRIIQHSAFSIQHSAFSIQH